jgi:hypothetical protein
MVMPMRCEIASVLLPVSHGSKPKCYKEGGWRRTREFYIVEVPKSGICLPQELSGAFRMVAIGLFPFSALI